PNGAGKSTTMRMIAGFLAPSEGTAKVCGHDVQDDALAARRTLGYLPEGAPLYAEMTPRGLLGFIADLRGLHGATRRARIDFVVQRLALDSVLEQAIDTLSKGFRRRVGLAIAILHDPAALILDEPTDGLDPNQKHEVRALISELARERTLLLSTHILEEVEAVCTRAIIIAGGRILADDTPAGLLARALLDGMPGVSGFEQDARESRLYVFPQGRQARLGDAVAERLRQRGVAFDGLRVEHGRLDEVFRRITAGEAAP